MLTVDRQLPYGPPTPDDVRKVREAWYSQSFLTMDGTYGIVKWEQSINYGCTVWRECDDTYWFIRDVWGYYKKWLGPNIPYEVVPRVVEVIEYVRKHN